MKELLQACVPCFYIDRKTRLKAGYAKAVLTKRNSFILPSQAKVKKPEWWYEDLSAKYVRRSAVKVERTKARSRNAS